KQAERRQELEQSILQDLRELQQLTELQRSLEAQREGTGVGGTGQAGVEEPDQPGRVEQDPGLFESDETQVFSTEENDPQTFRRGEDARR
ncbi:MAG: hypothetical protein WBV82_28360, partial [Myxococcaceae bacterium]